MKHWSVVGELLCLEQRGWAIE